MQVIDGRVRAVCRGGCEVVSTIEIEEEEATPPRRRLPRTTTVTPIARGVPSPIRAVGIAGLLAAGALAAWAATPENVTAPPASLSSAFESDERVEGFEDVTEPIEDERFNIGAPEELTEEGEEPLHVRYPSLADWVHPVLAIDEKIPARGSRRFGAKRDGERPEECGKGHCGVDLFGARGTPVVAVAFGEVTIIRHDPETRSGLYVRIRHPEGAETSYMHLDAIAPGLQRGQEVEPGQLLGTLGRTGIARSAAHLHFSLAVPSGRYGMRYVDPLPYLTDSTVFETAVDGL